MKLSSGKLQFWEWKKTPVGPGTFFSLSFTDILHSSMQEQSSSLRRRIYAVLGGENTFLRPELFFPPLQSFFTPI